MKNGFVRVCAATPEIRLADTAYNAEQIIALMRSADENGAAVTVFPELCVTGYSCGDLFWQTVLLQGARDALEKIAAASSELNGLFFVGVPVAINGKLYNMAAAVSRGRILGLVPKHYLPNYNEFYEMRHFTPGAELTVSEILLCGQQVPVGTDIQFYCEEMPALKVGAEICEDLWVPMPPSVSLALKGATLLLNLSASDEVTGKAAYRTDLIRGQSARLVCGYIYASAGEGESTSDVVYSGHRLIAENGVILASSEPFTSGLTMTEIDVERLENDRRRMSTFGAGSGMRIPFHLDRTETELSRYIDPSPFVPDDPEERAVRCEEILAIQSQGLKRRMLHTGCRTAVVGISGGLDSTLALLVTARAFDLMGKDRKDIVAVTMPGFGTTDRTYDNAVNLIRSLGAEFREISIRDAVTGHLKDIGHDMSLHDVTYENSQARERTQILMDIANQTNGLVVGTGDLSELALGWATYNGDHMSMYGVNGSVPKTLVRHLVRYYADTCGDADLSATLMDVLDTPVSPELLPPEGGVISQKTEDLVGPYELHDFFLYHMLRYGSSPAKIYRLAKIAFEGAYDPETILKWPRVFCRRFFNQQFKRSCLPDGPKVGTVAVSPRGDLRMPSDACAALWLQEVDALAAEEGITL